MQTHFQKAAHTYNTASNWQDHLFEQLQKHLSIASPSHILDLGCGTGKNLAKVAHRFPNAVLHGLDQSSNMIKEATKNHPLKNIHWYCNDFLGFPPKKYDLIISNASLHWAKNIKGLLNKCHQYLNKNGQILLSVFLPRTFEELQYAINQSNPTQKLPSQTFLTANQFLEIIKPLLNSVESHIVTQRYLFNDLKKLLTHIKKSGIKGTGPAVFWTPSFYKKVESAYLSKYGAIWASIHVLMIKGIK